MSLLLCLFNLKVTTFNCHGIKTSSDSIQCLSLDLDILLLQETWLYPDELLYVSNLSNEFSSFSLSSMTLDDKLIRGRSHGGLV